MVAAITGGSIDITGVRGVDMEVVAAPLRKMGLRCATEDGRFAVESAPLTALPPYWALFLLKTTAYF